MKTFTTLFAAVLATVFFSMAGAQQSPNEDFMDGAKSVTYRNEDGVTLRLHVYQPPSNVQKTGSAIVFFFGGGWRQGNITQFQPHAFHLSNQGMVAIVVDYRVFGRYGSTVDDAVSDAKAAISWVRAHAEDLGVDPNRIVASGGSAGGHLAAATATVSGYESSRFSSEPNALVLFNPALDTADIGPRRPQQFADLGEALSPTHQLSDQTVPTLILHGTADTTVPYEVATSYCAKVDGMNGDCTVIGYEGATHGFFNKGRDNGRWYKPTVAEMDKFLHRLGYLN